MIGILLLLSAGAQGGLLREDGACSSVACRPGRECVVLTGHQTECVCITKCPDHWKPVCGSDGVSYDNHCSLHRSACIAGSPISPIHPGFCSKDREELLKREEFIEDISKWGTPRKTPLPTACLENDRNRLREFLVDWFHLSAGKQAWYSAGMSWSEILSGHFTSIDKDQDSFLDVQELLSYISKNNTDAPKTKADKVRELCLDALVEEGDVNMDWRLSYSEYKEIMQEDYEPSQQVCKLSGRMYNDGAETSVECNGCVCACGKWVCTSNKCAEGYSDIFNRIDNDDDDDNDDDYSDEDDDDDDDDDYYDDEPEDDPDVQDINWF